VGGAKKAGSTSSTLSNLENLYAAFAQQQKEKAKAVETKEVAAETTKLASSGATGRNSEPASVAKDVHYQAAMELELSEDLEPELPASMWSTSILNPSGEQDPQTLHRVMTKMPLLVPRGAKGADDHVENLQSMAEMAQAFAQKDPLLEEAERQDVTRFERAALASDEFQAGAHPRVPRTLNELREFEEAEAIAAGELDPTSPQALAMKKRHQRIVPRTESEAQAIEQNLIARHRSAVEQTTGHLVKELDLSASVAGMAPLTAAQNPYLYNESFSVGLTDSELEWLQTRPTWRSFVDAKRTNLALQQRDMKQDRDMVDQLFINVVNRLSQGPQTGSWIHPDDIKAQQLALDARNRLQARLLEIYHSSPSHWATLLHKYVPATLEKKMADHVLNPEFWSPSNPWLLTAFTKQLVEEAGFINKMMDDEPIEDEIHARMVEQGALREDDDTTFVSMGPLGQKLDHRQEEDDVATAGSQEGFSGCLFCSEHRHRFPLDPMNVPLLARHMNSSGHILPRPATGLCKRHQAKMAKTIKQARHLNLFTHKKSIYRINNVFKTPADWNTPDLDQQVYTDPLKQKAADPVAEEDTAWSERYHNQVADSPLEIESESPNLAMHLDPEAQLDMLQEAEEEDAMEDLVEQLGVGRVASGGTSMSSIETLAHRVTGSQTRIAETDDLLQAQTKLSASQAEDEANKLAASKRPNRTFSADSSDQDETDVIGDSMIKAALSKAKGNIRRHKDSL
jgi:ribosomal protein S18